MKKMGFANRRNAKAVDRKIGRRHGRTKKQNLQRCRNRPSATKS